MWFIGVKVEQETSAPPPKKNPGSATVQDDLTMAFHSFGGVNDQCGTTSWAVQETGMLPLLSCDSGMTAWLKYK